MKKKLLLILVVTLIISATAVTLVGCKKKVDNYQLVKENVSYVQNAIFAGENDNYKIKVMVGNKEKEFIANGMKENVQPYMQVLLMPKSTENMNKICAYKLVGESGEATGSMVKNILGASLTANVSDGGAKLGILKSITITVENVKEDIKLNDMLTDCISADKALEYAYKALEESIKGLIVDGKLEYEVCIKYISDRNNPSSAHYWYVSLVKDTHHCISALVNPKDGSIISIKK